MTAVQLIIDHPRLRVSIKDGDEGPRHDPYHYSEYAIETRGKRIVYHRGALGSWLKVNGARVEVVGAFPVEGDREAFIEKEVLPDLIGWTLRQLHRMHRKRVSRCRECGSRQFKRVKGHPGETFFACVQCEHISAGYFDIGAVQ